MKKDQKNIQNNQNKQNKQIPLSRPYYGIYAPRSTPCLNFPNPDSFKQNQKLMSRVPVNTHYFGKVLFYPVSHIDKIYNDKINCGQMNASRGPYFIYNNVAPASYSSKYGKKSRMSVR